MTNHVAAAPDAESDIRWREWQARGAAGDRRTATIMANTSVLVLIVLASWLLLQLV